MYNIVRFYKDDNLQQEVIESGLTLEEAQDHCNDPETSSRTAQCPEATERTQQCGDWFDGYRKEGGS